jgi:O-methyltransferase involved in polyketide biosynthesis
MRKQYFFLPLVFVITFLFYYLNFMPISSTLNKPVQTSPNSSKAQTTPRYKMVYEETQKNDTKIYLLFWSSFFGAAKWFHDNETMSEDFFKKLGCSHTNCVMTHKIDLLPRVSDFDAVMLHFWINENSLPPVRSPRQLYIMVSNE